MCWRSRCQSSSDVLLELDDCHAEGHLWQLLYEDIVKGDRDEICSDKTPQCDVLEKHAANAIPRTPVELDALLEAIWSKLPEELRTEHAAHIKQRKHIEFLTPPVLHQVTSQHLLLVDTFHTGTREIGDIWDAATPCIAG